MSEQLPPAVSTEALYMAAILEELRVLRSALVPAIEPATAEVALREPVKRRRGRPKKKPDVGA